MTGGKAMLMSAPISKFHHQGSAAARIIPELQTAIRDTPRTTSVRLMTYNVQMGFNWSESLAVIRHYQPDVLCLQEVVPTRFHEPDSTSIERMCDDLGMSGDLQYLWGNGRRCIGNMTLTARGSVEHERVLRRWPTQPYGMVSRVRVGEVDLAIANLHLSPMFGWPPLMFLPSEWLRRRELVHLNDWAADQTDRSVVVAGDFNTFDGAPAFATMKVGWQCARDSAERKMPATRPTYGLRFAIDHIFTRDTVRIHNYDVVVGGGADHRAVTATLEFASD